MSSTRPDTLTPGFAALLKRAAEAGQALRVEIDEQPYDLTVEPASGSPRAGIWANYDAERLRAVLRRNASLPGRAAPDELERLIAEIRAQRGQDSRGRPANT